jgi:hypothetical protein
MIVNLEIYVSRDMKISRFKEVNDGPKASPILKKSRDLLFSKIYRISRLFLLNYVSKSRDFLYVSRDLFFAPILAKKILEILQSQAFLSLVSEREP